MGNKYAVNCTIILLVLAIICAVSVMLINGMKNSKIESDVQDSTNKFSTYESEIFHEKTTVDPSMHEGKKIRKTSSVKLFICSTQPPLECSP